MSCNRLFLYDEIISALIDARKMNYEKYKRPKTNKSQSDDHFFAFYAYEPIFEKIHDAVVFCNNHKMIEIASEFYSMGLSVYSSRPNAVELNGIGFPDHKFLFCFASLRAFGSHQEIRKFFHRRFFS